jgi:alkylation response protein AidB-like acyl-CoA dehydrogenase
MQELPWERLQIAISGVENAQTTIDQTVAYVRDRKVFGTTVGSFQNTRFKLAELQTKVQIARVFVDKCMDLRIAQEARHGNCLDGEVLGQRPPVQGDRRVRSAARWLRLHVGVPDGRRVRRCASAAHLWRHATRS